MSNALTKAGFKFETKDIVDDARKANQLHTFIEDSGKLLKVSFVEDAYFDVFPAVKRPFGKIAVVDTEEIPGLYHRKLRTVAGSGEEGDSFEGGRQKARDLFDLYVLSQSHLPIKEFIDTLPYQFPRAAFDNGLASMPWFELMDELSEIRCASKWNKAKEIDFLQEALYDQIGAKLIVEELDDLNGVKEPEMKSEPSEKTPDESRKQKSPQQQKGLSR